MSLYTKRPLRVPVVEQFTDPGPLLVKNRADLKADLIGRGYDEERAERLSALATRPDCWTAFDGHGARRPDLPGAGITYRDPDGAA